MDKVLVTGAGGFVGHHLVRALIGAGHEVYAASYKDHKELRELLEPDHLFVGDLTDYEYTSNLILSTKPKIIYHLAALSVVHTDTETAKRALENNLALQFNLLEAVKEHAPDSRLVAICSGNVYGKVESDELPITETTPIRPLNAYSVSKLSQEYLALQYYFAHKLDVVILRPFNHTGAGQTENFVIPAFARQFAKIKSGSQEPEIKVGNLNTARDFTDVRDMVEAYIMAADKCESGQIYNIGSGQASKISEILSLMSEISGVEVTIKEDSSRIRGVDVPVLISDSSKFRGITGWEPKIPFKKTLQTVLDYWEEKLS